MNQTIRVLMLATLCSMMASLAFAQRSRRGGPPTPSTLKGSTVSPVAPGEAGIAWYSTWDVALKEAKRSNRPILFMAAASQCGGVPGTF